MVTWLNIEDVSAKPTKVWLTRQRQGEEWSPLRKVDCKALNDNVDGSPVLIQCGRATADPEFGIIRFNFIANRHPKALTSATWFYKDFDVDNQPILIPVKEELADVVEDLYQRAVFESSSMGNGIDPLLEEQIPIDDKYHIMLQKTSEGLVIRKLPKGWFGKTWDLQRGYGHYEVDGEKEEEMLGPVTNLIFVVHGIGEAMWSREDFTLAPSLIEDVTIMRIDMQKRQIAEWKQKCEIAKKQNLPEPPPPNRVEMVPIFWYDRLHSSSNTLMRSLKAATLSTIPALREIANDVIFDVLMYLTPNFCYEVLECVTDQIIEIHSIFKKIHKDYNGSFSLMGHSLGSVICWDLLSILKEKASSQHFDHGVHITPDGQTLDVGYQQYASGENANQAKNGSWGPSLPKPMFRCLPFTPEFTIFLGSPLGLFLTLRGAHPVFDELRENSPNKNKPKVSPFTLPSNSIHNIFHPSDPVAYRIEPLLLAQGTENFPPPVYLTRHGESVRLHVKAKQMSNEIRKTIQEKQKSIASFMTSITEQAQKALKQIDDSTNAGTTGSGKKSPGDNGDDSDEDDDDGKPLKFPLAGGNGRMDYQLQPRVIDNEYLSAVTAHICYWTNTDILDYIIDLTQIQSGKISAAASKDESVNSEEFVDCDNN